MEPDNSIAAFEQACLRSALIIPRWLPGSTSVFWYRREVSNDKFMFFLIDCDRGHRALAFDHEKLASKLSRDGQLVEDDALPFSWVDIDKNAECVRFKHQDKVWKFSQDGTLTEWEGDFYEGCFDQGCEEIASPWSREPASITLVNQTTKRIDFKWISNDGDARFCGPLQSGRSRVVNSWLHHYWRLELYKSAPRRSVAFQLKSRRCTVVIEDSPLGLSLSWRTDPLMENDDLDDVSGQDIDPRLEPFLRKGNVWVRKSNGSESQVSFRGFNDNEFKDIYASPDGHFAIAMQCKPASKASLHLIDVMPQDQFRPKLVTEEYLRAGDNVEVKRPCLFNLTTRAEVFVDNSLFANPYAITSIGWSSDSQKYYFVFNERGHQHLRLLEINQNGKVKILAEEKSDTFVDYHQKTYFKLLPDTKEFLWASERDNWNHIYLFDLNDGTLKCQITKGEWNVHSIDHVDVKKRKLWARALGIMPDQDPYYAHLVRVNFDGSMLQVITEGHGSHSWQWGPGRRFLIDTWSRVDYLPRSTVRDAETGKEVVFLQQEQLSPGLEGKWRPVERFNAPGRDEKTQIYGILVYPRDLDTTKSYPVIEFIYAGPQDFYTAKAFRPSTDFRVLADKGYIVVRSDGMGTNWRSKTFHNAATATRAVIHHADFYKAAVAGAGSHDNRLGVLLWSEMFMGYPVDESYDECSNVTHAHKLGGALMLCIGGMDNNVDPASTLRLGHKLIEADKDFDMVIVPKDAHHAGETPWAERKMFAFFKKHLQD
ncbi:Prolyl tripeptidyl peptidase [Beauveria bassiana D1-5]|uniref:Probable dipeptidyl-aminopeptidase B n=1 Tax=Beauveria bassiana D1-5 TaxID=1245745 RepID=A0A0A2VSG9_BEABA|nr:Prolyl tripeptidyl peptidase [Beauveria bassiana D1-5]